MRGPLPTPPTETPRLHCIRVVGLDAIGVMAPALTISESRGVIPPRDENGMRQIPDSNPSSMPSASAAASPSHDGIGPATVSVVNDFPEDLYDAMRRFVGAHPSWDQYRVMQVAVAGFLFQQGSRERAVARHYLDGLFDRAVAPETAAQALQGPMLTPIGAQEVPFSAAAAAAAAPNDAMPAHPASSPCLAPVSSPLLRRQGAPLPPHRLR